MPIKSSYPDLELQDKDIFSFLFKRQDRPFPDHKVIFQSAENLSQKYTFSEIRRTAIGFGRGLKSVSGWRKGSVVALFSPNDVEIPSIVFGTLWAGGVLSPANPGYTVVELAHQLQDSGATIVVCHLDVLQTVRQAAKSVGIPEDRIFIVGDKKDDSFRFKHWTMMPGRGSTIHETSIHISPKQDLAFLVYSSGTTGKPKGVELTHHNMTSNILQFQEGEGGWLTWDGSRSCPGIPDAPIGKSDGEAGDKVLACLPFFHIYGLNVLIHHPLYTGVTVLVMARFDIETFCRLIEEQRVTFSYIVPPMVTLLCKHPCVDKYELGSLRMTHSGAAPLSKEMVSALFRRTGIRVKQGYGLSETSPVIFQQRWQDWDKGIGSNGSMVPNVEVRFCSIPINPDEENMPGTELKRGETGELYVRGPNVFKGYHNNVEATRACLDNEGWFRTGDVGYIDLKGDLYITDRVKELIKYKGFQVAPAELEGYLADHELIDDVAVVGVESQDLGTEVPRAYIVRKGGLQAVQNGDAETIVSWINARVANHKKLRGGIKFVESVPKSVSGKILRRLLKEDAKKESLEGKEGHLTSKL